MLLHKLKTLLKQHIKQIKNHAKTKKQLKEKIVNIGQYEYTLKVNVIVGKDEEDVASELMKIVK